MNKTVKEVLTRNVVGEINEGVIETANYFDWALKNTDDLTEDDIKTIVNYHRPDGSFALIDTNACKEARLDFIWNVSYKATLILIKRKLVVKNSVPLETISKALDFCAGIGLRGHGYEASETEIDNAIMFGENGIIEFFEEYRDASKSFHNLLRGLVEKYNEMLKNDDCVVGWAADVKSKLIRAVELLDESIYYAAYGSNLNKKQMMVRCSGAECVGVSTLEDYRLKFALYLTVEPSKGYSVPLGIWRITESDRRSLDRYEGYPGYYRREVVTLKVNGVLRKCIIYIMNRLEDRMGVPPTGEYYKRCSVGYKEFGLDISKLEQALRDVRNDYLNK